MPVTATASMTETSTTHPVWHVIAASASTTHICGIIATDGTTHGMTPGTAGMHPTIATVTIAGTTGDGAGTIMAGTADGTVLTTMEDTMAATIGDIGVMPHVTSDNVARPILDAQTAAGWATGVWVHLAQQALALVAHQEVKAHAKL